MLSRILRFHGGSDQYEDIKGRNDPGNTTKAADSKTANNVNGRGRSTERQPDAASKPTDASQATNPDGTFFRVVSLLTV